jgi:transposase-like protein
MGTIPVKQRTYTDQKRREILAFAEAEGVTKAAERFKVSKPTVYGWRARAADQITAKRKGVPAKPRSAAAASSPKTARENQAPSSVVLTGPPATQPPHVHITRGPIEDSLSRSVEDVLAGKGTPPADLKDRLTAERYIAIGRADAYSHVLALLEGRAG